MQLFCRPAHIADMKDAIVLIHPDALQPPADRSAETILWLGLADDGVVRFADPADAHEIRMQLLARLGSLTGVRIILASEHNSPRLVTLNLRSQDLDGDLHHAFTDQIRGRGPASFDDRLDRITDLLMADRAAEERRELRTQTRMICISPDLADEESRRYARHRLSTLSDEIHVVASGPLGLSEADCWLVSQMAGLGGWVPRELRGTQRTEEEDF